MVWPENRFQPGKVWGKKFGLSESRCASMRFGCDGAGDGSDDEPLHGAAEALAQGTSAGEFQGGVSFPAEGLGLRLFVGEVGGGGGKASLAGFAVHGEVIERLEVFVWDGGGGGCWRVVCGAGTGYGCTNARFWCCGRIRRLLHDDRFRK